MKIGLVTKLGQRNKTSSKKFDDNFMSENMTSLSFSELMVDLEQSRSQLLDA